MMAVACEQVPEDVKKFLCSNCNFLLRDAVQQMSCGHWLCECCAKELSLSERPQCPLQDCLELWNTEEQPAVSLEKNGFVLIPLF